MLTISVWLICWFKYCRSILVYLWADQRTYLVSSQMVDDWVRLAKYQILSILFGELIGLVHIWFRSTLVASHFRQVRFRCHINVDLIRVQMFWKNIDSFSILINIHAEFDFQRYFLGLNTGQMYFGSIKSRRILIPLSLGTSKKLN